MPLHLDIVTPEKKIFSDTVDNVYLPGADGEMGILPQHAGLVTALKPGELRYLHNGKVEKLAIGSGFAEVTQTKVIVLTDMALGEAEIDEAHCRGSHQARPGKTRRAWSTAWMRRKSPISRASSPSLPPRCISSGHSATDFDHFDNFKARPVRPRRAFSFGGHFATWL